MAEVVRVQSHLDTRPIATASPFFSQESIRSIFLSHRRPATGRYEVVREHVNLTGWHTLPQVVSTIVVNSPSARIGLCGDYQAPTIDRHFVVHLQRTWNTLNQSLLEGSSSLTTFARSRDVTSDIEQFLNGLASRLEHYYDLRSKTFADLEQACREAAVENWDGYGAVPFNRESCEYVKQVLSALTSGALRDKPEIRVDPDGEISLNWQRGPRLVFSISVAGDGSLSYAGLFGPNEIYGVEQFSGTVPKAIAANLERFLSTLPPTEAN